MGIARCWPVVVLILTLPGVAAAPSAWGTNVAIVEIASESNHVSSCQLLILVRPILFLAVEDTLGLATLRAKQRLVDVVMPGDGEWRADCDVSIDRVVARFDTTAPAVSVGPTAYGASSAGWGAGVRLVDSGSSSNHVSLCQHLVLIQPILIGGPAYGVNVNPSSNVLEFIHRERGCATHVGRVDIEQPTT